MSQMIVYSVPWTYKQITIELRYNYKTIPVARLWMARVIPSLPKTFYIHSDIENR